MIDDEVMDDDEETTQARPEPRPGQIIEATFLSLQAATEKLPDGQALSTALGIALPSGIACIVLPENVDQQKLRGQVEKLSTYDEVIGFSYVAIAPTFQRKLQPGEAFSDAISVGSNVPAGLLSEGAEKTGHRLIVAAITRTHGRLVRVFDTSEVPGSATGDVVHREVNSEPTVESPIFLSPLFEGIWEVAQ